MAENAWMNEGTLAAAWNKGEYCLTNMSVISQLPYVGTLNRDAEPLIEEIWGS